MKSLIFFLAVFAALIIGGASWGTKAAAGKQRATFQFNQPVVLQGIVLKGEYLFVHDDGAMKRGEACTSVYKGNAEVPSKLVVSFHCIPTERTKASHFMVRTAETAPGIVELREFQFNGDKEGHVVPAK
ncbi:MAG: hypothetical protein C5B55_06070 [Blastocatellia bacterium]|nr:MAG: hypothetical protein C5B55_06070 [Blastocatellia bacterium]